MCNKGFNRSSNRREHEIERHRLSVVNGEFFSPTPYVIPLTAPSQSQAQSSQGPEVSSLLEDSPAQMSVGPDSTIGEVESSPLLSPQMSVGSDPPPTLFLTPSASSLTGRGLSRSSTLRTASSSPLVRHNQSALVSPSQMSVSSTQADVLPMLSPTVAALTRSSTRRAASSSPVTRRVPTPRAASVSTLVRNVQEGSPQSLDALHCSYCLHEFSNRRELNRHIQHGRCRFQYNESLHNLDDYCVLRRPPNYNSTYAILSKLSLPDRIKMCQLNNWAMPKLWPLVFPGQIRQRNRSGESQIPQILIEMTAGKNSTMILRELLRYENEVSLPKQVILKDDIAGIQSVLPTAVLTPGTAFISRISGDTIIASTGKHQLKYYVANGNLRKYHTEGGQTFAFFRHL